MNNLILPRYAHCTAPRAAFAARVDFWRKAPLAKLERGSNEGEPAYYETSDREGGSDYFREVKFADRCGLRGIDHKGWFTDSEFQDDTMRGIVAYMGHGRWLAGYHYSCNHANVYFPDVHDSERATAAALADFERATAAAWADFERATAAAWATAYINDTEGR